MERKLITLEREKVWFMKKLQREMKVFLEMFVTVVAWQS